MTAFDSARGADYLLPQPNRGTRRPILTESDAERRERLAALEAKLAAKRKVEAPKRHTDEHYSQAQMAWRMVIEMVAGLGIGFGIGFGLDALFGTKPFLMIVFTLLGFAAGIKTVLRTARELNETPPHFDGIDTDDLSGKDQDLGDRTTR